jgi:hypothetical protein
VAGLHLITNEDDKPQAYISLKDVRNIKTPDGYDGSSYLLNASCEDESLLSLSDIFEISWNVLTLENRDNLSGGNKMKFDLQRHEHKIRGLNFCNIDSKSKKIVADVTALVLADNELNLEIRDGYLNIYYCGGSLLKIKGFAPQPKRVSFHFEKKYFPKGKGTNKEPEVPSWFPEKTDDFEKMETFFMSNESKNRLKNVMDGWFNRHPKGEKLLQQNLSSYQNNVSSPWIRITQHLMPIHF